MGDARMLNTISPAVQGRVMLIVDMAMTAMRKTAALTATTVASSMAVLP